MESELEKKRLQSRHPVSLHKLSNITRFFLVFPMKIETQYIYIREVYEDCRRIIVQGMINAPLNGGDTPQPYVVGKKNQ